jgi:hypothetical protein
VGVVANENVVWKVRVGVPLAQVPVYRHGLGAQAALVYVVQIAGSRWPEEHDSAPDTPGLDAELDRLERLRAVDRIDLVELQIDR